GFITTPPPGAQNLGLALRTVFLLLLLLLHLLEELIDGLVHLRLADVLEADDALVVEDVDRRPAGDVPLGGDRPGGAAAVPPVPPAQLFLLDGLLQGFAVPVTVDADEREGLALEPFHERPLVRVHGPARPSPIPPEVEHHDLAAEVTQPQRLALDVLARDL